MTTFVQARTGERMVAWLGGKNMGAVTQWLYPSSNGKVLKIGASVKTVKSFEAYRMETSGTKALAIFPQKLPVGLKGKVVFLHSIGNAPTSGNALVAFDLPEAFQETDTTGGAGQTLGALLCLTTDFQHLEISDWNSRLNPWFLDSLASRVKQLVRSKRFWDGLCPHKGLQESCTIMCIRISFKFLEHICIYIHTHNSVKTDWYVLVHE